MDFETKNIIFSAKFSQHVRLDEIHPFLSSLHQVSCNARSFGMSVRVVQPKCSFVLFNGRKFVSAGYTRECDFTTACEFLVSQLQQVYPAIGIVQTKVENMVVCFQFDCHMNLQAIANSFDRSCYDARKFPGVIMRLPNFRKGRAIVFSLGRTILTGLTSLQQYEEAFLPLVSEIRAVGEIRVPDRRWQVARDRSASPPMGQCDQEEQQ